MIVLWPTGLRCLFPARVGIVQAGKVELNSMRSLESLLPGFLRRISKDPELSLIFLQELWPQVVGEQVAGRSRPAALEQGRLTCHVLSESWMEELTLMKPILIGAINQYWGSRLVDRIQLRVRLK